MGCLWPKLAGRVGCNGAVVLRLSLGGMKC
jgi:hypothetical protein